MARQNWHQCKHYNLHMGSYFWVFFPPPIYLSALIPLYISAASHLPHYTWETSARIWPSAYGTCLQTFHTWITVWKFTNKKIQNIIQAVYQHLVVGFFFFFFFTSRMKNLAVFTFDQVFFSLETGLMFIPATSEKEEKSTMDKSWVSWFICDSWWRDLVRSCTYKWLPSAN